jgi:hypothetical protein
MKTMIREIREDMAGIREKNKVLRKEITAVREEIRGREEKGQTQKADWVERMKMRENRRNKWKHGEGGGRMVRKGDRGENE